LPALIAQTNAAAQAYKDAYAAYITTRSGVEHRIATDAYNAYLDLADQVRAAGQPWPYIIP
jgi:hypothetical protein